jgi:hypothetical protein
MPAEGASESEQEACFARHRDGPLVQVFNRKDGINPMAPETMGVGVVHLFLSSLLAGFLLHLAAPRLTGYGSRVLFVRLLGVFAAFSIEVGNAVWFHHPWDFQLFAAGFDVSNWLVAGAVLGLVVKPPRPTT